MVGQLERCELRGSPHDLVVARERRCASGQGPIVELELAVSRLELAASRLELGLGASKLELGQLASKFELVRHTRQPRQLEPSKILVVCRSWLMVPSMRRLVPAIPSSSSSLYIQLKRKQKNIENTIHHLDTGTW